MDEMNIVSKFTNGLVSKAIRMVLKHKLGYDIDIQLNELKTKIVDGETHAHVDLDIKIDKEQLTKILKEVGLN